jgi:hypothetical protein
MRKTLSKKTKEENIRLEEDQDIKDISNKVVDYLKRQDISKESLLNMKIRTTRNIMDVIDKKINLLGSLLGVSNTTEDFKFIELHNAQIQVKILEELKLEIKAL